jgi:GTP-sensing pleiotropic transcriptional regulator CodY
MQMKANNPFNAKVRFRDDREAAMAAAADEPRKLKPTKEIWKFEAEQFEEFTKTTLPLIGGSDWRGAVVMLRRDAFGDAGISSDFPSTLLRIGRRKQFLNSMLSHLTLLMSADSQRGPWLASA